VAKLSTINPGVKIAAKLKRIALIIRVKKPNVNMVIGKVNIRSNGLSNIFTKLITAIATKADLKSESPIPGITFDTKTSARPFKIQFAINLNIEIVYTTNEMYWKFNEIMDYYPE
jgi:hypothetical protein